MSTGIDISFVKETYRRMTDDELIQIATQDAYGLTTEAMKVVKAEIKKRGLDESIYDGVEAQNRTYSIEEVDAYCDIVSSLSCPYCGNSAEKLNATMTGEVISFIFFTNYDKKIKVGCPDCLDKENNNALIKSVLLGWWGIPWGIIRTIQSIMLNINSKQTNRSCEHNDYLRMFTLSVVGELETYKSNRAKLQGLLTRQRHS